MQFVALERLWQDLRYAARGLRRSPAFTAATVLTLALGIGANTAIYSVVYAVLLRDLPYPEPGRLAMLWERHPAKGVDRGLVTPADFVDWRQQQQAFEDLAFIPGWPDHGWLNLVWKDGSERIEGEYVPASFFRVMGVAPILGRAFLPEEDQRGKPPVAILSHALWQRRFAGDPQVIGKRVTVDSYNLRQYTVVGVMPRGFQFPNGNQIWLPQGYMDLGVPAPGAAQRCCAWFEVIGRLRRGVTMAQASAQMKLVAQGIAQLHPNAVYGTEVAVVPLLDQIVGPVRRGLYILLGAVGFVLLIACANVANLLLARSGAREREIVIRASVGATRARLVRQLLTESLLLASLGGVAGVFVAWWGVRLLHVLGGSQLPRAEGIAIDPAALGFCLVVSLLTGVLFGLAPALRISRAEMSEALKASAAQRRRLAASRILIVAEVGLTLVLLIGAGLMVRTSIELHKADAGFRPENILLADFDMSSSTYSSSSVPGPNRPQVFFERLIERVRAVPGVELVAAIDALPLAGPPQFQSLLAQSSGIADAAESSATRHVVTPDYFRVLGIPLKRGQFFVAADTDGAPRKAIVSESLARRLWPGQDPIGKQIAFGSRERPDRDRAGNIVWREVAGVVGDVRSTLSEEETQGQLYVPYFQWSWRNATLLVRTKGIERFHGRLDAEVRAVNASQPVGRVRTMDGVVAQSLAQPNFRSILLSGFSVLALALALVGIYGVMSYSVAGRRHEIGIRLALGAQVSDIHRLLVGQGLVLAALGLATGLAGALLLTRALAGILYGVPATDWKTFAGATLLLGAAATAASYLPARRATRVNPVSVLRAE